MASRSKDYDGDQMMKVGVVGAGFVGTALLNSMRDCTILICDPAKSETCLEDLCEQKPDLIFICVPTPSKEDGSVDDSIVRDVITRIPPNLLVVVKSTITPDHLVDLSIGRRLVYNPEFLTQRSANEDFLKSDSIILGGDEEECRIVQKFYHQCTRVNVCPVFTTDIVTASMVKYTLNCIFANKVIFMNEIHALHQKIAGSTWEEFTQILANDSRMGPSHLQVPGPDGYFGFGGACFPKDTQALLAFADSKGVDLSVLRQAVAKNRLLRG
jgi:nucleotide sugar dehydrogenase